MNVRRAGVLILVAGIFACVAIDAYNMMQHENEMRAYNAWRAEDTVRIEEDARAIMRHNAEHPELIALWAYSPYQNAFQDAMRPREKPMLTMMIPLPLLLVAWVFFAPRE